MNDKKYIKITKDKYYYEVFYLENDEIEKSCFVFKDVLTPERLEEFEDELNACYPESAEFDTSETYTMYTLHDLIESAELFEDEPQTYFDMMLKANEIANSEIRKFSDIDKYDVRFFESENEFESVDYLKSEFPHVDYSKPFFVIDYIDDGILIKVLNANEVKSYKDLTKIIEANAE